MTRRTVPILALVLASPLAVTAQAPATVNYAASGGSATFDVRVAFVPVRGTIAGVQAEVDLDPDDLGATSGKVTVPVVNLKTGNGVRDSHARGERALFTEKYPNAVFTLEKLAGGRLVEGTPLSTTATGILTVKATSRPISVPVRATLSGGRVQVNTQFKFNPYDFDVRYTAIADSVAIDVSFVLAAQ